MVDGPSESSEADNGTKPGRRGVQSGRLAWPRGSVGSRGSRVGAMRSLNPLLLLFSLSLAYSHTHTCHLYISHLRVELIGVDYFVDDDTRTICKVNNSLSSIQYKRIELVNISNDPRLLPFFDTPTSVIGPKAITFLRTF
jgi:hypothetical protein